MENKGFDTLLIQQYLQGKLDPGQMHEIEKQALDDPFLADALEGYSYSDGPAGHQMSILQRQLKDRIAQQQENKNTFHFTWQRLSIAAVAALMFISAGILFWMKTDRPQQKVASYQKQTEVNLIPGDTIKRILSNKTTEISSVQHVSRVKAQRQLIPHFSDHQNKLPLSVFPSDTAIPGEAGTEKSDKISTGNISEAEANSTEMSDLAIIGSDAQKKREIKRTEAVASTFSLNANIISGKVVARSDSLPVPGAFIRIRGTNTATQTNVKGEFMLPDTIKGLLNVMYIGYQPVELNVKPGDKLFIVLKEDQKELSEVVIAGNKAALITAEPVIGWDKYKEYLRKNTRYPKNVNEKMKGSVIVGFTVKPDGSLSDLRIIQGLQRSYNTEAVRLIKNGPAWKPVPGATAAEVMVSFDPADHP